MGAGLAAEPALLIHARPEQTVSTRTYLNEWLYMENLRAEDVLSVGYWFVHGVVNGEPVPRAKLGNGLEALDELVEIVERPGDRG